VIEFETKMGFFVLLLLNIGQKWAKLTYVAKTQVKNWLFGAMLKISFSFFSSFIIDKVFIFWYDFLSKVILMNIVLMIKGCWIVAEIPRQVIPT
jgi:hypothetical protein